MKQTSYYPETKKKRSNFWKFILYSANLSCLSSRKDNQKDTCLNNINLSLRHTQTHQLPQHPHQQQRHRSQRTYSKKTHKGLQVQGSLENVSSNPLGGETDFLPSTLRRSRSLAISRENIFDSFEIPAASKSRRQQLIPRAKLIEKPSLQGR